MTLEQIEAKVKYWETRFKEIVSEYENVPRSEMGLVSEVIRLSPEYRANLRMKNEAFAEIRFWNSIAVKARKLVKKSVDKV